MLTIDKEKTITSNYVFEGNILNTRVDKVELPDGKDTTREIIEHSGGVAILPVTDDEEIIMVRQYRIAPDEILLELPAGKLEPEEDPRDCAVRELLEETGFEAETAEPLFSFYTTPGYSDELLYLFQAQPVVKVKEQKLDEGEFVEVEKIKSESIMDLIAEGKIKDSKTMIGLLYYLGRK